MITDQSGNAVWQWDNLDPFGDSLPNQSPNGTGGSFVFNLRFPGQYYDIEIGTHYNYLRDYDPSIGRYIQSDAKGLFAGQPSTYAYVNSDPLKYTDPFGLDRWGDDPAQKWIPPDPARTKAYICDALTNKNGYLDRDDPAHQYDLSWRDAEHYLYSYTAMRDGGIAWPITSLYQLARSYGYSGAKSAGFYPDASPPSMSEANWGAAGVAEGLGANFSPNSTSTKECYCHK